MLALPGRSLTCSYGLVPRLSQRTRNYSSSEKSGDETIAHLLSYSLVPIPSLKSGSGNETKLASCECLFEKLAIGLWHAWQAVTVYFGRHYSSLTFQSSSPVPHSSQIIQSHVPVPCSSGESSPAIRDTHLCCDMGS